MACPLFLPSASPGDYYAGECAAGVGEPIPAGTLRHCCNKGYARGVCARAMQAEGDAIQFVVKAHRGDAIELGWSLERNHHPLAVGSMAMPLTPVTPLEVQAHAFGSAYLRQRAAR
jgi:hypothetical protein